MGRNVKINKSVRCYKDICPNINTADNNSISPNPYVVCDSRNTLHLPSVGLTYSNTSVDCYVITKNGTWIYNHTSEMTYIQSLTYSGDSRNLNMGLDSQTPFLQLPIEILQYTHLPVPIILRHTESTQETQFNRKPQKQSFENTISVIPIIPIIIVCKKRSFHIVFILLLYPSWNITYIITQSKLLVANFCPRHNIQTVLSKVLLFQTSDIFFHTTAIEYAQQTFSTALEEKISFCRTSSINPTMAFRNEPTSLTGT